MYNVLLTGFRAGNGLSSLRAHMDVEGLSLEHSLKLLLDLRLADDVPFF